MLKRSSFFLVKPGRAGGQLAGRKVAEDRPAHRLSLSRPATNLSPPWFRRRKAAMIRPATASDVPTILSLVHELAGYERAAHQVRASREQMLAALFGPDPVASCLLAVEEPGGGGASAAGTVVGFALWFRTFSTWLGTASIYLEDLFVKPQARGGGHGRALLAALAEIAVERGYGRVEWSVLDWNEPAQGFYRRLGAAPQDEWTVWRLTGDALRSLGAPPAPK
jgi:GNAT superfamily N-acetyltransferase